MPVTHRIPLAIVLVAVAALGPLDLAAGSGSAVIDRFLAFEDAAPLVQYRAIRRLRATNEKFKQEAALEARTSLDETRGFLYEALHTTGSSLVRDRALLPILQGEARAWADGTAARSALTPANYEFSADGEPDLVRIRPRRKDTLLLEGVLLVAPGTGDLRRIEGRLAKSPSFWTRRVDVERTYERIGGVRVPTRVMSRAALRWFGASTFEMTYEYEEINGQPVAAPALGDGPLP
jgi:hypothetical protein